MAKPPVTPSATKGKKGSAKGTIKIRISAKIEELLRLKQLDMLLERRNLGLETKGKGDMKEFMRDVVKKLKNRKKDI